LNNVARSRSRSRRGTLVVSLTTTPHSSCRRPYHITRVLRWFTRNPSSVAIAATRATKKRRLRANASSPQQGGAWG
jgi:hypothetical protein